MRFPTPLSTRSTLCSSGLESLGLFVRGGRIKSALPQLLAELDESMSEAAYDNGALELKLVKKAAAPGKRLAIK